MLPPVLISIFWLLLQFVVGAVVAFIAVISFLGKSAERKVDTVQGVVRLILPTSPQHLATEDVWRLVLIALLKHILAPIGWTTRLQPEGQGFTLPRIEIHGQLDITAVDIQAFREAVALHDDTPKPPDTISPFFLVALTVPLTIQTLASNSCPIRPLGAVNTRNVFKIHDPALCRSPAALREKKLTYSAVFGGADNSGHRRKRGVEFCITIDVLFEGKAVLSQELWYMQFLSPSIEPKHVAVPEKAIDSSVVDSMVHGRTQSLDIGMDDPRKWAACCKDYNPIHVSKFTARLLGFRSVIAHGNHVAALVVEQLATLQPSAKEKVLSKARKSCWHRTEPFTVEVSFARPLLLPARAEVSWSDDKGYSSKSSFTVSAKDKMCISGSICALDEK